MSPGGSSMALLLSANARNSSYFTVKILGSKSSTCLVLYLESRHSYQSMKHNTGKQQISTIANRR